MPPRAFLCASQPQLTRATISNQTAVRHPLIHRVRRLARNEEPIRYRRRRRANLKKKNYETTPYEFVVRYLWRAAVRFPRRRSDLVGKAAAFGRHLSTTHSPDNPYDSTHSDASFFQLQRCTSPNRNSTQTNSPTRLQRKTYRSNYRHLLWLFFFTLAAYDVAGGLDGGESKALVLSSASRRRALTRASLRARCAALGCRAFRPFAPRFPTTVF